MVLRTYRTLWDTIVGAAAALLVFGAVPAVLVGFVGLPIPHHWTEHDVVSWRGLFDLLAVVSWFAWAACAWPILRSVAARVRSGDLAAAARLSDRIAVRIALGVLTLTSLLGLGASVAGASVAGAPVAVAPVAAVPVAGGSHDTSALGASPGEATHARGSAESTRCVVEPGDTLATLAAACYGEASDWPAIAAANLGRMMDDGTRFVDPAVIAPGWTLLLPALDAGTRTADRTVRPAGVGPAAPRPSTDVRTAADPLSSASWVLPLAELAAAGVSALVAGLLARRARQLRRLRAFLREEGDETEDPHEREADLGALLAPFERVPLVDLVEVAARHLGEAIATLVPTPGSVQWLRAGRDGVEVRFAEPLPEHVLGWRRTGHATWRLPATVDLTELQRALPQGGPWRAALLPVGDDDRGTWLLPVEPGSCVAVIGPRAADLVLAMRAAVATWSWHEALVVTEDADVATAAAGRGPLPTTNARTSEPEVLFVGDPDALTAVTRRACAVLTTRQVDTAEVTIVVDTRAASAHPLGLTVRPQLLDHSWTAPVHALIDTDQSVAATTRHEGDGRGTAPSAGAAARGPSPSLVHRQSEPATLRVPEHAPASDATTPLQLFPWSGSPAGPGGPRRSAATARGRAEVRLLASVPGIVGLQGELPTKRARRAVELVAYLAVHAPDPVTGDRLRTRVLGSADADAAAKTLFNTVGAARRALGVAPDGQQLLPPASRSGHYRLSSLVTVDALRACALVGEGLASGDRAASTARLREGLELVRGEPLGGILTGYGWWRAEGHERRVADAVVDGACALIRAAVDSGDLDLARWALVQARKVEPYSESLTRAAMRLAAASGDARRLHAEWRECRHQMDELDPGGAPSARTERLYALLRAELTGDRADDLGQASFAAMDAAPFKTVPSAPSTV